MKDNKLHILQHSLGLDQYGVGVQYRNYFMTGPGSSDYDECCELVKMGLMKSAGVQPHCGGDECFIVTPEGINYVSFNSPTPPKLTRSQKRYRAYLKSDSSETFGEWLKNPYWNDYRARLTA